MKLDQLAAYDEECPHTTAIGNNRFTDGTKQCEMCVRRHENFGENHNMRTANQYHEMRCFRQLLTVG